MINLKLIIFFFVALFILIYLAIFWHNRHEKIEFHLFSKKIEINLGIMAFGVFLDGAILTALLFWLFM